MKYLANDLIVEILRIKEWNQLHTIIYKRMLEEVLRCLIIVHRLNEKSGIQRILLIKGNIKKIPGYWYGLPSSMYFSFFPNITQRKQNGNRYLLD